jgi:hypothetical protein
VTRPRRPPPGSRALLLASLLLLPAPSAGQVARKKATFHETGKFLTVSVGFREMFNAQLRKRLRNGFAMTVVMRLYVYEKDDSQPVAFSARTVRAVYDLWDERFRLRVEEPAGTRRRSFRRQRDVVDRLTSTWRFPVARLNEIRPNTHYFVAVIAEVNPMSEALLAEVRRWLRNPHGSRQRIYGESFFGSFVSLFVNNKIRRAEKTFRARTQPFFRRP